MSTASTSLAEPPVDRDPNRTAVSVALSGGLSVDEFKLAFRNHPAGVAVITADNGGGPVGLTATSVFSVSAEPPLLVFSLSSASSSAAAIVKAETVVVHLLSAQELPAAKLFATSGVDRFADRNSWGRLVTGEPFLHAAPVWIRGRIVNLMEANGSTVVAVHALQSHVRHESEKAPLVYHDRSWHHLGGHSRLDA